ncbi:MAG: carboxypeptidase-like regulatory domain-containing protein, partial [Acidobacteria bacterium]|nr:carboxypeptidase-like regulatory domain-containing protein [Acidobacteriota bacterium]
MQNRPSLYFLALAGAVSLLLTVTHAQQGGAAQQGGRAGGAGRGAGQAARDAATQQPTGTAMILGQIVTGDAGTPVRRARVSLVGQGTGARSSMTDDEGRYVFTLLPAGRYTLNATKAGFVAIAYGAKAPGRAGTPIQLTDGQKLEAKPVTLPKGGVVTGVVLDEHGEPAPGTPVRAMRQVMRTGEKRLESAGTDTTDDRGQYRIYGLQPGQYVVYAQPRNQGVGGLQASVAEQIEAAVQQMQQAMAAQGGRGGGRGGGQLGDLLGQLGGGRGQQALEQLQQQLNPDAQQSVGYAPVFFPGTTSPSGATAVEITTGQERYGVDFQLQLTQTSTVTGSVQGPEGTTPGGTQITLVPKDSLPGLPGNTMTARAGQDGHFVFRNVIPGQYMVTARAQVRTIDPAAAPQPVAQGGRVGRGAGRGGTPPEILWAVADVFVDGNDQSVTLQLQNGMTIAGRIA